MKKEILLLVLGALASIFLVKFNFHNGFEYVGIKIQSSLIDYAGTSSVDTFLTSQIVAYFIFLIFILSIKKQLADNKQLATTVFLLIVLIGIFNESFAFYESFNGTFKGRHLRIGNLITILGVVFLIKIKRIHAIK